MKGMMYLGYVLEHDDGVEEFTAIYDDTDHAKLEHLKDLMGELEYHGKKSITGARWEIRSAA